MASEKGDLPQDTDSLPPNYASSETFTDSPPPAYRKTNTVRLQITRVVCLTVLTAGFLTGAFILTHTWITNRNNCDCSVAPNLTPTSEALMQASILPQVEAILDVAPKIGDMNNNIDSSSLEQESRLMDIPLPLEEDQPEVGLELVQEAMEEEKDSLQSLVENSANRIRLPVDMLLGNPALAGKDVQCKVEKKVQNLGGGILSKTIMVICDDDNDDDDSENENAVVSNPFEAMVNARPSPQPPMSLLAPILKMMAARANARLQRQMKPKAVLRRFPQPMMQPIGVSMNGPFPQPFNMPYAAAPFDGPMPFPPPMLNSAMHRVMGQPPLQRSFAGPMHVHGNSVLHENVGPIHFFPQQTNQEEEPRSPFSEEQNINPENFNEMNDEEPRNMLFREDFNEEEEQDRPFIEEREPIFRPFLSHQREEEIIEHNTPTNVKVIHGFPPQIPDAIKEIVSSIMRNNNNRDGQENMPVIAIKAIPNSRSIDSKQRPPKSKLLLPFPFRAVKMQSRGARMLGNDEDNFNSAPFPLSRGAIPASFKPIVMPDAAGRALDSPVTLPSPQEIQPLRFFPGRLLRLPVPLQGRAITHMEMKHYPNTLQLNEDNQKPTDEVEIEQNEPQNVREEPFGPPRRHTVIRGSPPMEDNISEDSGPMPPFLTRFPLPPPPKFAREGRSGVIREVNPDAEVVIPAETRAHHMISVY